MSRLLPVLLAAVLVLLAPATAAAFEPPAVPGASAGFDGEVSDVAISGPTAYVAGNFESAGTVTGAALAVDATTGARLPAVMPPVAGQVRTVISDGFGGWYIGGDFDQVGEVRIRDLARIGPDGAVDLAFQAPSLTSQTGVWALARFGPNRLVVGGRFRCVGGNTDADCTDPGEVAQDRLTALDATTGAVQSGFFGATGINGNVTSLLVAGTRLVVGGRFGCVGGDGDSTCGEAGEVERRNVVAYQSGGALDATWAPEVDTVPAGSPTPGVEALATDGSQVVVGGLFTCAGANISADDDCADAGESERFNLASFTMPGAADALNTLAPNPNDQVRALAFASNRLYFGGLFDCVLDDGDRTCEGGEPVRASIAAWQLAPSQLLSWDPKLEQPSFVSAILTDAAAIRVAGTFTCTGSDGDADCADAGETRRRHAAAFAPADASTLPWDPALGRSALTLARNLAGDIAIGGEVRVAGAVQRRGLAAIDLRSGELLPWSPDSGSADDKHSGVALALSPDGRTVYAAMATPVCTGWNGDADCIDPGESDRGRLIAVDAATAGVDPAFTPRPNQDIRTLTTGPDGTLYVGGPLCYGDLNGVCGDAGETPRPGALAALTPGGGVLPWSPQVNSEDLDDLAVHAGRVYVTGDFSCAGGTDAVCAGPGETSRRGGAAFDAGSGALLPWDPQATDIAGKPAGAPMAVAPDGSRVVLAGRVACLGVSVDDGACDDPGEAPDADGLVALDPVTGVPQTWGPTNVVASVAPSMRAVGITPDDGTVLIGGVFSAIDLQPRPGLASLRAADGALAGWAPGLTDAAFRIRAGSGVVAVVGPFKVSGGQVRMGFARYGTYVPPPAAVPSSGPAPGAGDRTAPVLSGLSIGKRFRRGTALVRVAAKAPPTGTVIRFRLSEKARVRFTVARRTTGRRVGKRCVRSTRANTKARRCVRSVAVRGSASVDGKAGANRVRFAGRLTGKIALKPGSYVLTAGATDGAGNRAAPRSVRFSLLAAARRR